MKKRIFIPVFSVLFYAVLSVAVRADLEQIPQENKKQIYKHYQSLMASGTKVWVQLKEEGYAPSEAAKMLKARKLDQLSIEQSLAKKYQISKEELIMIVKEGAAEDRKVLSPEDKLLWVVISLIVGALVLKIILVGLQFFSKKGK